MKYLSLATTSVGLVVLATSAHAQSINNAVAGTIDLWTLVAGTMGVIILCRLTK